MRPQLTDALATCQDGSRLGLIVEGQLRGEAAYSQSRPLTVIRERLDSDAQFCSCATRRDA